MHIGDKVEIRLTSGKWKGGFVISSIEGADFVVKGLRRTFSRDQIKPQFEGSPTLEPH